MSKLMEKKIIEEHYHTFVTKMLCIGHCIGQVILV